MKTSRRLFRFIMGRWWHAPILVLIILFYTLIAPIVQVVLLVRLSYILPPVLLGYATPNVRCTVFSECSPILSFFRYVIWSEPTLRALKIGEMLHPRIRRFRPKPKIVSGVWRWLRSRAVLLSTGLPTVHWRHIVILVDAIESSDDLDLAKISERFIMSALC